MTFYIENFGKFSKRKKNRKISQAYPTEPKISSFSFLFLGWKKNFFCQNKLLVTNYDQFLSLSFSLLLVVNFSQFGDQLHKSSTWDTSCCTCFSSDRNHRYPQQVLHLAQVHSTSQMEVFFARLRISFRQVQVYNKCKCPTHFLRAGTMYWRLYQWWRILMLWEPQSYPGNDNSDASSLN